jgi:sugar/nucleoside kinase (ribokinase family)
VSTLSYPDVVIVGHICQDILPDGDLSLGGSVSFASVAALRMGCRVGVVTSASPDLDLAPELPGAEIACHLSEATTVFENIYLETGRRQIIHQRADELTCEHVPPEWRRAPMAYLGSIDRELDSSLFRCFDPNTLICVMPQGMFRQWDDDGHISYLEWTPPEEVLGRINVLVISEEDVSDPAGLVSDWGELVDIMVVTHAERGATVYREGGSCHYPTRPAREVDLTGAGDVFAAAFLIRLHEIGDPCEASRFANAAASMSVEGVGVAGIPYRWQVDAYLKAEGEKLDPLP